MFSIAASYQSSVTVRTAPWMKDRTRRRACPTSSTFASLPSTLKSTTQSPSLVSVSDFPNNDIKGKRKRVDEDAGNSKRQRLENGIQATFAVATWLPPAPTVAKRKRTPCEGDLASEEALTASPSKKAKTSLSPPRPDIYTPTASQNAELGGADCPGAELGTHEGYSSGTPAARSDDSETQVQLTPIPALSPDSVRDSSLDEEPGCTDSPPPSEPTRNDKHEEQIPTEATRSTTRGVTTTLVVSTLSSSSSLPNVDPNSPPLVVGSVSLLDTVPPSPPGTERERRIQSCKVDYTDVGREDRRGRDYRVLALTSLLNSFPIFTPEYIEETLDVHAGFYVPAYLNLADEVQIPELDPGEGGAPPPDRIWKACTPTAVGCKTRVAAVGEKLPSEKAKGKARELVDAEFEDEKRWLDAYLFRMRVRMGSAGKSRSGSTKGGVRNSTLEFAVGGEGGACDSYVQCECCFGHVPSVSAVGCSQAAHPLCLGCLQTFVSIKAAGGYGFSRETGVGGMPCMAMLGCISTAGCDGAYDDEAVRCGVDSRVWDAYVHSASARYETSDEPRGPRGSGSSGGAGTSGSALGGGGGNLRLAVEQAMTEAVVRVCPNIKCGRAFVKDVGCNKMRCEACGAVWCYVCRKVIDDSATHFEWDLYGDFGEGGAGVRFYGPGAVDIGNDIEVVADPDPDAGPADSCGSGDDETRRSPPSSAIESTDSAPRKRKCLLWDREPLEVIHAREANEALDRALAAATATSAFAPSAPGRELDGQSKIWIDGGGAELVELKEKLRLPLVFDTGTSSTSQLGGNGVGVRRRSLGMGRGRNFGRYDYHCGTRRVSEIEMRAGNIVQAATDRSEQGGGGDFGGLGQLVSWVGMGRSGVGKELKADGFTWSAWADRGALYSATEEAMDHLDEAEVVRMLVSQTDFEGGRGM